MRRWQWVLVVVVLVVVLGGEPVIDAIVNGPRVGPATELGPDGLVVGAPAELAAAAGLSLEVYALARALASEHGADPTPYLQAVAWAIRNKAAERGRTIFSQLTDGAGTAGDGRFGEQKATAGTKYASTRFDPHRRHVQVAEQVVGASSSADPTGGATHFFSPRTQDKLAALAAAGDERYVKYSGKDAAYIEASWTAKGGLYASGAEMVFPPGVDPNVLTLFRRLA